MHTKRLKIDLVELKVFELYIFHDGSTYLKIILGTVLVKKKYTNI